MLRDHMKANHSSDIKCKDCRSTFGDQSKFEEHLVNEHGKEKTFDCEFCDDSFYTDWRLRKHIRSHEEHNIKFCHYYNNSKECPYQEFGCKFRHAESEQCRYQNACKNRLCQFQHHRNLFTWKCKEVNWENKLCQFQTNFEVRMKNHMKGEHGIGDFFMCDQCDFQTSERGSLKQHTEKEHKTKHKTCGGNCSDRMYAENTFECVNCETVLCKVCSQSDNIELCWGCENLLRD